MKNAKDWLNRVQRAAKKVAEDPRTLEFKNQVKSQTKNLSAQSQVQIKRTLNDAAVGIKGLADKINERKNVSETPKISEKTVQSPVSDEVLPEVPNVPLQQPKMEVNLSRKTPVFEPKIEVTRDLSERPSHAQVQEIIAQSKVVPSDEQKNIIKPVFEEKPDKMALLRNKTRSLAEATKSVSLRYGSSVASKLEPYGSSVAAKLEAKLEKPKEILDTRKRNYDSLKGKLVLSRNLWITGAVCGIIAAIVGTFYTYEAILIQRRQKELLNIEIQIKEIELKRLHQLYEDEIRDRLSQSEAGKAALAAEAKRNANSSWIAYLTGR